MTSCRSANKSSSRCLCTLSKLWVLDTNERGNEGQGESWLSGCLPYGADTIYALQTKEHDKSMGLQVPS